MARGEEDRDADIDEQSTLYLAGDLALDGVALLVVLDDPFPALLPVSLLLGEHDEAALVLEGLEENVDLVADIDFVPVAPVVDRDHALGLVANVDDHVVANDVEDSARDDSVWAEVGDSGRVELFERAVARGADQFVDLTLKLLDREVVFLD